MKIYRSTAPQILATNGQVISTSCILSRIFQSLNLLSCARSGSSTASADACTPSALSMMPHSLRDIDLPPSPTYTSSFRDVNIKLNQDRSQIFSPGNVVSGYVVFPDYERKFSLDIEFFGRSTSNFFSNLTTGLQYVDEVLLFSYKRPLNDKYRPGNGDWTQDSHWKFEFRFPSNTENRRTVNYHHPLPGQWRNSVHALPPSLEHADSSCSFSVEYMLRARVYVDKRLVAETSVPLLFAPSRPTACYSPISPLQSPRSSWTNAFPVRHPLDTNRPLPLLNRSLNGSSVMTIFPPIDIATGQTMSLRVEVCFSGMVLETEGLDPSLDVQIEKLQLFCEIGCRGKLRGGQSDDLAGGTNVEDTDSSSCWILLDAYPPNRTIELESDDTFSFCIEAKVPDRLLPSFGSFIVFSRYDLHARIIAKAKHREHKTIVKIDDIQVISPTRSPIPARRTSPPVVVGPVPVRRR